MSNDHKRWSMSLLRPPWRPVIALVAKGISNEEISVRLHMTPTNVNRVLHQVANAWKQGSEPRHTLRIRLTLCFLLGEGHLEKIDWPIPELEGMTDSSLPYNAPRQKQEVIPVP